MKIANKNIELKAISEKEAFEEVEYLTTRRGLSLEKNLRKIINVVLRLDKERFLEKNQKPVKSMTISIEWKKSSTWGSNPHASARIEHEDGSFSNSSATASGCGYDKESTVIADIFNQFLLYKLYQKSEEDFKAAPYGVRQYRYEGGIGVNCYYRISEFLDGKFKRVASGKTFDVYSVEFN